MISHPPATDTERVLTGIWSEVLELSEVGVEENFFDLGGHSVLLHMVQDRITTRLGKTPPLVDLFQYPTVRGLAGHLDGGVAEEPLRREALRSGGRARLAGRRDRRTRTETGGTGDGK
ncbi:phosphopantetheine-binding protein [Streptomyces sp. NPDC001219]